MLTTQPAYATDFLLKWFRSLCMKKTNLKIILLDLFKFFIFLKCHVEAKLNLFKLFEVYSCNQWLCFRYFLIISYMVMLYLILKSFKKSNLNMDSETPTHLNCCLLVCCLFCLLCKSVYITSQKSRNQKRKLRSVYVLSWRPYNGFVIQNKRLWS